MDHSDAVAARRQSLSDLADDETRARADAIQKRLDAAVDLKASHLADVSSRARASVEALDDVAVRKARMDADRAAELDADVLKHQMELEGILGRRDSKVEERRLKAAAMNTDVAAGHAKAELRADIRSSTVEMDATRRDVQAALVDDRRESIVANVRERQGHLQNFAVPSVESSIE